LQRGLKAEIKRFVLLGGCILIIGIFNEHLLLTLLAGGALYIIWAYFQLRSIYRWLEKDPGKVPPEITGVWGDLADYIYRQQRRNSKDSEQRRRLFERIINITSALDEGLIILNADRTLEWWNPAAKKLLSLRNGDRNQTISNIVRDPDFVTFINAGDFDRTPEITLGEQRRIIQFSAATFGADEIVLVARDVTQLRRLEEMRKDFVANISHEIRTPLTVLSGYLESMQDGMDDFPAQWEKPMQQMNEQARRLNALANDLVLLSRMESVDTLVKNDEIDLASILEQIVDETRALASDHHHLHCSCPSGLKILGDAAELHSALSNLVVNAVRHNPDGANIEIIAQPYGQGLEILVRDDGIGIDPVHLPRLTERFYRPDASRARGTGGTGLGLAIAKHALQRHDARLFIRSTPGKGSVFACRFPAERIVS